MTRRYFAPELPPDGGPVVLSDAESHHAIHVMRLHVGDAVTLFDGEGSESTANVTQITRNQCTCEASPAEKVDREPACEIHFGIAMPKADRARELLERLTELGVKSVTPLVASRTQRPLGESSIEKLKRGVIEACKQSGRNKLLEVRATTTAADFFCSTSDVTPGNATRLIAHASPTAMSIDAFRGNEKVIAAVGPEGGWTDEEIQLATEHGFQLIELGNRIYRIETAATVIAAVLVA